MSGIGSNLIEITPADESGSNSNDPLSGIINGIPGLAPLIDNLTSSIGQSVDDLQGELLSNLTKALGVKDMYILYVSKICQGDLQNRNDPNSDVNIDKCTSYHDGSTGKTRSTSTALKLCVEVSPSGRTVLSHEVELIRLSSSPGLLNISNSIPSSLTVGPAQVSVPLIASVKSSLNSIVNLAVGAATAMFALLIIGCIASGLTAVGSGMSSLLSRPCAALTTHSENMPSDCLRRLDFTICT